MWVSHMEGEKTQIISIPNESTAIALIAQDIGYIKRDLLDIKSSLREAITVFASKEELAQTAKDTQVRLAQLESEGKWWRWISPTIAAGASALATYLITFYFTHTTK